MSILILFFSACKLFGKRNHRVFTSTQDGRLIALDAETGKVIPSFGDNGAVNLNLGKTPLNIPESEYTELGVLPKFVPLIQNMVLVTYAITPAIIGNKVIVGSALADNYYQGIAPGLTRAYDAESGKLLWSFNPITPEYQGKVGAANTWAMIATDAKNQLVFIATWSLSLDYYGVHYKNSVPYSTAPIALNANTGQVVWSQQLVHHNIYDYDLAAQPTRLVPRDEADQLGYYQTGQTADLVPAYGSPYAVQRYLLLSPFGMPCNAPPWGNLTAINLQTGQRLWQVPFGAAVSKWGGEFAPQAVGIRLI